MLNIGIILSSVRQERNGKAVADWTLDYAKNNPIEGVSYELVDLIDYDLPFLGKVPTPEQGQAIQAWSEKMNSFDGFIFIVAEYNHAITGTFKNALDFLKAETKDKVVGFVGYGGLGGIRAIENIRVIAAELGLASVQRTVNLSLMTDFVNMSEFTPADYHRDDMLELFNQVSRWGQALKTIR